MELMDKLIDIASSYGFSFLLAILCLIILLYDKMRTLPKLNELASKLEEKEEFEKTLSTLVNNSNQALQGVKESNNNVAHSLELLSNSTDNNVEFNKQLLKDNKLIHKEIADMRDENSKILLKQRESILLMEQLNINMVGINEAKRVREETKRIAKNEHYEKDLRKE